MTTNRSRPRRKKWPFPPMPSEAAPARALVFAPLAWLKLQFLCHAGPTEVAGFGLSHPDDPLYLEDVIVVRQRCTLATVCVLAAASAICSRSCAKTIPVM